MIGKGRLHSIRPRVVERDPVDHGEHVDSNGLDAHLKDDPGTREILHRQIVQGSTECNESPDHAFGVVDAGTNPNVKARRADMAVRGKRMRAHDDVLNAVSVELGNEISVIGAHRLPSSSVSLTDDS